MSQDLEVIPDLSEADEERLRLGNFLYGPGYRPRARVKITRGGLGVSIAHLDSTQSSMPGACGRIHTTHTLTLDRLADARDKAAVNVVFDLCAAQGEPLTREGVHYLGMRASILGPRLRDADDLSQADPDAGSVALDVIGAQLEITARDSLNAEHRHLGWSPAWPVTPPLFRLLPGSVLARALQVQVASRVSFWSEMAERRASAPREKAPRPYVSQEYRRQALDEAKHRCRYCGERNPSRLSIDHIEPLAWNGETVPWNLQVLCVSCNSSKSYQRL